MKRYKRFLLNTLHYVNYLSPENNEHSVVSINKNENRFYFVEFEDGKTRSVRNSAANVHTLQYFNDFYKIGISLNTILVCGGAELVDSKEEADIDLSPESLSKETIIGLLQG